MKTRKNSKGDVLYSLPFGPDLIYNNLNRIPVTPAPDIYIAPQRRLRYRKSASKVGKHERRKESDKYCSLSSVLIAVLMLIIVATVMHFYLKKPEVSNKVISDFDPNKVPDYALASSGAEIRTTSATTMSIHFLRWKNIKVRLPSSNDIGPEAILHPWFSPGDCWAFSGQEAIVQIKLSHIIIPLVLTLEHIPKNISPTASISSAPRKFTVYAVDGTYEEQEKEHLGSFEYRDNGKSIQSFFLKADSGINYPVQVVEVKFEANHGHPDYTCVYKIRVHGDIFF